MASLERNAARRLGRISADEAEVSVLEASDELGGHVIRVPRGNVAERAYDKLHGLNLSIAHLLFPDNFPKPVASRLRPGRPVAVVTKLVDTSEEYLEAMHQFYKLKQEPGVTTAKVLADPAIKRHIDRVDSLPHSDDLGKLESAGIYANPHFINTGFKKDGTPVYFEVNFIHPALVRWHCEREKITGTRRKQIEEILREIERLPR